MAHQDPTWTVLEDYQGHEVNSSGQVRNIRSGIIMKMSLNQTNVQYVSIRNTTLGRYETPTVGGLVASVFCPGRTENENTVLHLNGDTLDNRADNLMWTQRWHAMAYHREIVDARHNLRQRVIDGNGRVFANIVEAAMNTGVLPSAIDYAVRYNDSLSDDTHSNFIHKVWPGGHVFKSHK